jgi:hypothetical protein
MYNLFLFGFYAFSNTGGTDIIRIARENYFNNIQRRDYSIVDIQKALANAAFSETGLCRFSLFIKSIFSSLGGLWHASLINRHLVTFFVPFLPLERSHVRICIQRQLEREHLNSKYQYKISDNDIIDQVLDLIEFSPPDLLLYSVSGCKKVRQKLDFILETNRVLIKQDF